MPKGHKGGPKTAGSGRKKGVPNKLNATVKEMVIGALDAAGGQSYLLEQSEKNPTAFLTLVGKVLPTQITGEGDGPVQLMWPLAPSKMDE